MAMRDNNILVAWIFGAVLALLGLLGFVPALVTDDLLLGIFEVGPVHNFVHLFSGGLLLAGAAIDGGRNARLTNMTLGTVYALVAVVGFAAPSVLEAVGVSTNSADHVLHVLLGVVLLGAAFMVRETSATPMKM